MTFYGFETISTVDHYHQAAHEVMQDVELYFHRQAKDLIRKFTFQELYKDIKRKKENEIAIIKAVINSVTFMGSALFSIVPAFGPALGMTTATITQVGMASTGFGIMQNTWLTAAGLHGALDTSP